VNQCERRLQPKEKQAMPLLSMETYLFPEDLFNGREGRDDQLWWVLYTRRRMEKVLARKFAAAQVTFFLPLHKKKWRDRNNRAFSSFLPLFPSYVFICERDIWAVAPKTNEVLQILKVTDQKRLQADLGRIYRVMQTGMAVTPEEGLQSGALVLIESGPLAGMEGRIIKRGKNWRFFVEVDFLRRGVSVEVEGWTLRPLSHAPQA
jgi:transcription antitermination factor NusG